MPTNAALAGPPQKKVNPYAPAGMSVTVLGTDEPPATPLPVSPQVKLPFQGEPFSVALIWIIPRPTSTMSCVVVVLVFPPPFAVIVNVLEPVCAVPDATMLRLTLPPFELIVPGE